MRNAAPIALLVLAVMAAGCGSSKHKTASVSATAEEGGPMVPWTAKKPPQLAVRQGVAPPCVARNLSIPEQTVEFSPYRQGGIAVVPIHNGGARACSLTGRATAHLVKKGGPRQLDVDTPTSLPAFPGVVLPVSELTQLRPGENAGLAITWQNWCDPQIPGKPRVPPSALRITLPHGRGSLSADYNAVPDCVAPGTPSTIGVARFQPSQVPPGPPWTHALVNAAIPQPLSARRGEILHYRVVLRNSSNFPVRFSTCPAYVQQLAPVGGNQSYQLNCAAAHPVGAGGSIAFAMQIRVPKTAPLGSNGLFWLLDPWGAVAPEATARVTILG